MTYWNLVLHRGVERFAADLAAHGGAGLITPDLIPEEAQDWIAASDEHGLDRVFLVAPSSTPERLTKVTAACRGFVYAASTMGVTGARSSVDGDAAGPGRRAPGPSPTCRCASGSGCPPGRRPPSWPPTPTASSWGPPWCATLTGDGELGDRLEALRALTAELADGVRTRR